MSFFTILRARLRDLTRISDGIDVGSAAEKIKSSIWFKGPNVWILAFSIVIASVGLNINSTAVIIGAMLISPLMGPIMGIGLAIGTNDFGLLKNAGLNLVRMIVISLLASCLFFLISPLELANPTELEARTTPTIYDVLIALFGGSAGMLEMCRKEKGTVISGVAIATALMPPLCTAGYGLAHGAWNFFFGASFLFLINSVFIIIATYLMAKYFHFKEVEFADAKTRSRTRNFMTGLAVVVMVPSLLSAVTVVRDNQFQIEVQKFVASNKFIGKAYIYDYKVHSGRERSVDIYLAGTSLSDSELGVFYDSAKKFGIEKSQLNILKHEINAGRNDDSTERIISGIYRQANEEVNTLKARIRELEGQIEEAKSKQIPFSQIAKEIRYSYPEVTELSLSKGAQVSDSLGVRECISVLLYSYKTIEESQIDKMQRWLQVRLDYDNVVITNITAPHPEILSLPADL